MIAALYNIPNDPIRLAQFAFHNRAEHDLAVEAIYRKTGVTLQQYPLDPIKMEDVPDWLDRHQSAHAAVNQVLGIAGNDLSDVDPNRPEQLQYWIELHAQEHRAWGAALGIG